MGAPKTIPVVLVFAFAGIGSLGPDAWAQANAGKPKASQKPTTSPTAPKANPRGPATPKAKAPKSKKKRRTQGLRRRGTVKPAPTETPTEPQPDPPPPPPPVQESGLLAGMTAAHNAARAAVGVAPLQWSPEIAGYAQQWADELAANGCALVHRPDRPYGENLYYSQPGKNAAAAVAMWTAEQANYDYENNTCDGICGHYTQVVWKNTTKLGCGVSSCDQKRVYVCNYDPRGNYVGQSPY